MTPPRGFDAEHESIRHDDRRRNGPGRPPLGVAFEHAYQPVVDLHARSVYAHEALVRGPGGEGARSVLAQVDDAQRYRFDQACSTRALEGAAALGIRERVSINFLANAVYRPDTPLRTTLRAARADDIPLDRIILEVTEGERVEDAPCLMELLAEYRRLGLLTAIDDFGAGYAGLTLLADFQPDLVKIDMALVRGIERSPARQVIVRGLLRMCEELGVAVIGEGVETVDERDFLLDEGVSMQQGYLFARPAFRGIASIAAEAWPGR